MGTVSHINKHCGSGGVPHTALTTSPRDSSLLVRRKVPSDEWACQKG